MKAKSRRPPIPRSTQLKLWIHAGGRCEFPGCNIPLWRDRLTLQETNYSQIGHVIAASPDGPRGDPELSSKLAKCFDNLILLCPIHHKLIDSKENENNYPVDYLKNAKQEHEKRISRVTDIQSNWKTNICFFHSLIGGQRPVFINYEETREAVLPRYPASDHPIDINLTHISLSEDSNFFSTARQIIESKVSILIKNNPSLATCNHFSIFPLAPIPLLIYFGFLIGDTLPCDIYQFHRETTSWKWNPSEIYRESLTMKKPQTRFGKDVILKVAISGLIHKEMVVPHFKKILPMYEIQAKNTGLTWLRNPNQIVEFRNVLHEVTDHIRRVFGLKSRIHLFPAIPAPIAIELGRSLLTKVGPDLVIYDFDKTNKEYYLAMEV